MEITKTRFNAGDAAPDWLLTVEPLGPHAVQGVVSFCVPCDVLEFEDHYMVFPALLGQIPQVMYATGEGCRIIAAGKDVRVAIGTLVVQRDIFGTFRSNEVFGRPAAAPPVVEKIPGRPALRLYPGEGWLLVKLACFGAGAVAVLLAVLALHH